ncbi:unnamed protein product [Diabrotica balteata]|uniref:Reverse transcriptase n=1 Tax=Diabrotica balteata TaxID=107213 RepID=A0A9N9SVJ7_DIABA|nr:unnamed protein product [Diabrotica balteata]
MDYKKTTTRLQQENQVGRLDIEEKQVERVNNYKYLGIWVNKNNDQDREIRTRIKIARQAFIKMKTMFVNRDLPLELRIRALRCYVFSTLLYGMESWTLKVDTTSYKCRSVKKTKKGLRGHKAHQNKKAEIFGLYYQRCEI